MPFLPKASAKTLVVDHVCDLYASLLMVEDVCSLLLGRIYDVRVQCQQITSEYLQSKHVYVELGGGFSGFKYLFIFTFTWGDDPI